LSYLLDNKISYADSAAMSAYGRVRTADSRLLGEYRYMYGSGTSVEMNDKIVGSGTLVADQPRNCYLANVTTASGDRVVRQTKQYHPYIVGTSNIGVMSFTMNAPKVNLKQSIGLYDDFNGIIFRLNGLEPEMVIRKNGVDVEIIPRSEWNFDRLDGTKSINNPSGINVDFSKTLIFYTDYQWSAGRVRTGFSFNGITTYVHNFNHSNLVTEAYINQPSLPCRWEIENTGVTASTSQLMLIAASVYGEGTDIETGFSRSVSTDGAVINVTTANSATNGKGILAFRLKNTLVSKQNHAMARLKNWLIATTEDIHYKIVILPDSTYISNTPTWNTVPGYGWCDYTRDFTLTPGWQTSNEYAVVLDSFALSGGGTGSNISSGTSPITEVDNRSNTIYQNYDSTNSQIMAIVAFKITNDSVVKASMNWIEIK